MRKRFDDTKDYGPSDPGGPYFPKGYTPELMCSAQGCPNRWTVSPGHLCSAHAWASAHEWPAITQQQQWDETDRARARGEPKVIAEPLTAADKRAIMDKLLVVARNLRNKTGNRDWAYALKARHEAGERLTKAQVDMYRAALQHTTPEIPK